MLVHWRGIGARIQKDLGEHKPSHVGSGMVGIGSARRPERCKPVPAIVRAFGLRLRRAERWRWPSCYGFVGSLWSAFFAIVETGIDGKARAANQRSAAGTRPIRNRPPWTWQEYFRKVIWWVNEPAPEPRTAPLMASNRVIVEAVLDS